MPTGDRVSMGLFQNSATGFFLHHVSTAGGPSACDMQWHGPGALCAPNYSFLTMAAGLGWRNRT